MGRRDAARPLVTLLAPVDGQQLAFGSSVPVQVQAEVQTGEAILLQFWAGDELAGEKSGSGARLEGQWGWLPLRLGEHTRLARAYNQAGDSGVAIVRVTVVEAADANDSCPDRPNLPSDGCPPGMAGGVAGSPDAEQLAYASELRKQRQSGSARYYAGGLAQAAQQFQGKKVTSDNVMQLVQTLLSGGQEAPPAAEPDLLTSLLGGAAGQGTGAAQPGIDMASLLNAGMAYLSAKGSGQNDMQALMGALMTAAQGGNAPHRAQSGALIANALLQAIGGAAARR